MCKPRETAMSVEEPAFGLQLRDGQFEVREYPALVVAEVVVEGDQSHAAGQGFRILASYIFGGNARRESIAMTAPVTLIPSRGKAGLAAPTVEERGSREWLVRFTMPKQYTMGTLPPPKDPRVSLRATPPERFAVIRFSGLANPHDAEAKTVALSAWIQARRLKPTGPAALAQYDPPWTLWFLRRNEVMFPIAS